MSSNPYTGPAIPDFEKDAQTIASYEEAKLRYEKREMSDAESAARNQFNKKRDAIRAEIQVADALLHERRSKAQKALKVYATRYPHRVDRNRPSKPTLLETLLSFGMAGRLFNRAVQTAADAQAAQALRRHKEHDEEELEQQLKRQLHLQEEAIKRRLESPEGIEAFHKRPGVATLYKRVEEIKAERAAYAARLERGEVTALEMREREFSANKISPLELPFAGVTIVRIARYGDLTYFILRDLEKKLWALPYDPRLEPLIDQVFDVYRLADSFEVKLTKGPDGRPMTAMAHYTICLRDEEVARAEYRRARTVLRNKDAELAAMPPEDERQQQIIELLVAFCKTIGPQTTMFGAAGLAADSFADAREPSAPPPGQNL